MAGFLLHRRADSFLTSGMPDWIAVICLGIIEKNISFTRFRRTGHLLLAEHWLPKQSDLFNTVIQCGTVLAVIVVFASRIRPISLRPQNPATRAYVLKLAAAFVITGVGGLILKKLHFKLPESVTPVASATLIGGVFFLVVEQWLGDKPLRDELTWRVALAVGLAQLLAAIFPGTSRSGVTIWAALVILRNESTAATEFLVSTKHSNAPGGRKSAFRFECIPGVSEIRLVELGTPAIGVRGCSSRSVWGRQDGSCASCRHIPSSVLAGTGCAGAGNAPLGPLSDFAERRSFGVKNGREPLANVERWISEPIGRCSASPLNRERWMVRLCHDDRCPVARSSAAAGLAQ